MVEIKNKAIDFNSKGRIPRKDNKEITLTACTSDMDITLIIKDKKKVLNKNKFYGRVKDILKNIGDNVDNLTIEDLQNLEIMSNKY